jgi:hypothetical protein
LWSQNSGFGLNIVSIFYRNGLRENGNLDCICAALLSKTSWFQCCLTSCSVVVLIFKFRLKNKVGGVDLIEGLTEIIKITRDLPSCHLFFADFWGIACKRRVIC